MRFGLTWALTAALLCSSASAQVDASTDGAADAGDGRGDFHSTESRYAQRMAELDADTRRFLDLREAEERSKLTDSYDQLLDELSAQEDDQRQLTAERMRSFLEHYPDAEYASHVRFRLADLVYVAAKREWLRSMSEYSVIEAQLVEEERWEEIPPQPELDLGETISLYQRVIDDNKDLPEAEQYEHLDGAYYMLGFSYTEASALQKDEAKAKQAFLDLLSERPNSELADAAQLFLGNIAFDTGEFDEAIERYTAVVARGPEGNYFEQAGYQLAWTYYKLAGPEVTELSLGMDGYDRALELFTDILDRAEEKKVIEGRESSFAPDALKYMAISFTDLSDFSDARTALGVAQDYFRGLDAPREYEWDVYKELAETLTQQARRPEAIEVYRFMQDDPRWQLRPENPTLMYEVAKLLASGIEADQDAAAGAVVELTERYNTDTAWWQANRTNPDALAVARQFIENSLGEVAKDYHLRAEQTGEAADFLLAAEKYQEYLEKFPISDDFYQIQAYRANALFSAKSWEDALLEYRALLRSKDYHYYGDLAVFRIADITRLRMEEAVADAPPSAFEPEAFERAQESDAPLWTVPALGFIEEMRTNAAGEEYPVYELSQWHQDFLTANQAFIDHTFQELPDDFQDYGDLRDAASVRRPKLRYMMAQLLYVHNHFEEAEPLLMQVIAEDRTSLEASYAAGLHVNMFTYLGDSGKVRELAKQYSINPPGPLELQDEKALEFENLLEGITFKAAMALVDTDREAAAEAFLAFIDEFPESEYVNVALYNAANSYDVAGKSERAIELFERYVATYPEDEQSRRLYFRIAATYESTLELEQAVGYYESLINNFPEDQNAADALYNAAFLKIGLGRNAEAARGFESYALDYPERADAEAVFWRAADQWEEVGTDEAVAFYRRYLQRYGMQNPDHSFAAKQRLAVALDELGRTRQADTMRAEILSDFDSMHAEGLAIGVMARHYAAQAAFRDLQSKYAAYEALNLNGNEEHDVDLVFNVLPTELAAFEEAAGAYVAKYGDFEYSTAALLRIGEAYMHYADVGFAVEPPPGLPDHLTDAFFEQLEINLYPKLDIVQEKGKSRLQRVIDFAAERKRYSDYVRQAKIALNENDPINYPADKPEIRGETEASVVFEPMPVRAEPPAETPEGGEE